MPKKVFLLSTCRADAYPFAAICAESREEALIFLGASVDRSGVITIPVKNLNQLSERNLIFRRMIRPGAWGVGVDMFSNKDRFILQEYPLIDPIRHEKPYETSNA